MCAGFRKSVRDPAAPLPGWQPPWPKGEARGQDPEPGEGPGAVPESFLAGTPADLWPCLAVPLPPSVNQTPEEARGQGRLLVQFIQVNIPDFCPLEGHKVMSLLHHVVCITHMAVFPPPALE